MPMVLVIAGAVTMKMINSTSNVSTKGVMLISETSFLLPLPPEAEPPTPILSFLN
jgi:hypothetical protein